MLNETNAKLAQLEVKINELDKGRKGKKPSCPVCYEEMLLNTRIAQCISGHLICWSCKEKMVKNDCPSCGRPVNGRAFGMESYLKYLFQDEVAGKNIGIEELIEEGKGKLDSMPAGGAACGAAPAKVEEDDDESFGLFDQNFSSPTLGGGDTTNLD